MVEKGLWAGVRVRGEGEELKEEEEKEEAAWPRRAYEKFHAIGRSEWLEDERPHPSRSIGEEGSYGGGGGYYSQAEELTLDDDEDDDEKDLEDEDEDDSLRRGEEGGDSDGEDFVAISLDPPPAPAPAESVMTRSGSQPGRSPQRTRPKLRTALSSHAWRTTVRSLFSSNSSTSSSNRGSRSTSQDTVALDIPPHLYPVDDMMPWAWVNHYDELTRAMAGHRVFYGFNEVGPSTLPI